MKKAETAVIFDLDSTVASTAHRHHLSPLEDPTSSWERYSLACDDDEPMAGTVTMMRLLHPYHQIHICSGRASVARVATEFWLAKHDIPYDYMKLRSDGDRTPNGLYKARYVTGVRESGVEVVLFVEDWKEAADHITEQTKVPALLVNPAYDWVPTPAVKSDGIGGGL